MLHFFTKNCLLPWLLSYLLLSCLAACGPMDPQEQLPTTSTTEQLESVRRPRAIFTFDIVSRGVTDKILPLFAKRKMPAMVYAESGPMDSGESWVLSWRQLRALQDVHGWEIGSHTITHPYLTQVSDQQLDHELKYSKDRLTANGLVVKSFATPYGNYNLRVLAAAAKYYESHRAAWGGLNNWPDYNDYKIRAYEISNTTTVDEVKQVVETAIAGNQVLVFLLHELVAGVPKPYEYNENDLAAILDYIATRPIQVTTLTAALRYSAQANLVENPSFTEQRKGWASRWLRSDSTHITLDEQQHGNVYSPAHSVKIVGSDSQNRLTSEVISVKRGNQYALRLFHNVQDLEAGGWAVWVDEYSARNDWLSGQWLGGQWANDVGTKLFKYKKSTPSVAGVRITIYTEAKSRMTLYVDSLDFRLMN